MLATYSREDVEIHLRSSWDDIKANSSAIILLCRTQRLAGSLSGSLRSRGLWWKAWLQSRRMQRYLRCAMMNEAYRTYRIRTLPPQRIGILTRAYQTHAIMQETPSSSSSSK